MSALRLVGALDPNFGWAGGGRLTGGLCDPGFSAAPDRMVGAYACIRSAGESIRLARDPLGLNKLFWAPGDGEAVLFAARPWRLVEAGCRFEDIWSVPAGVDIDVDFECGIRKVRWLRPGGWLERRAPAEGSPQSIAERIRSALDGYCAALAEAHSRSRIFVCLSGGLDSSGVAALAQRHFAEVTAVSFDLERGNQPSSADRRAAERLAGDLGLPLLRVTVTDEALLAGLDTALSNGIDWRDFNVHAALVNVALAQGIAAACDPEELNGVLVLTGDLANEYLSDYHAEQYGGVTYYDLPRLPTWTLQRVLIRGLETSHREVGPFQAQGLALVQVYAAAVDEYLTLPAPFLADPARKDRLSRMVFGDLIPDYVYARPKTRAQTGDPDAGRGVLGVCVEHGIDQNRLRQRFLELHRVSDPSALDRFIRAGRYRSSLPAFQDTHDGRRHL
jgi:asparagine synthetase B (glutamine-hydrolysing)